ncbi:MAG: hypothetical protein HPY59_08680 [Anaerolineae bacterium]|nr:hypothetical protein [Anaerolineae bacterium]
MPSITLKRISHQELEELLHIQIPDAAKNSGDEPPATSTRYSYSPTWDFSSQAYGIFVDNDLVGVYCMTCVSEADALWLGGYLIEQRYRAHGYGQTTLLEILKKINQDHPYCNTINLSIEPEKVVAERLCRKMEGNSATRRLNR